MKTLIYIIGFATILAGSTYFVAPLFRGYHEGKLKLRALEALQYAGYMDVDVEMNHLHASKIVIHKAAENEESVEDMKAKSEQLVRSIPGVHTDRQDIFVMKEGAFVPEGKVVAPKSGEGEKRDATSSQEGASIPSVAKDGGGNDVAKGMAKYLANAEKPESKQNHKNKTEPEASQVSSELYVEWNDRKNEINLDGKLSSESQKAALVTVLEKKFGAENVKDSLIVSDKLVKDSKHMGEVVSLISHVTSSCRGAGSFKMIDQPGRIELRGGLETKTDFINIEKLLAPYRDKRVIVVNSLKYLPEFDIVKNDEERVVVLSGYADKNNSVNLSSYVKRYTQQKENDFTFRSNIGQDARCEEYIWKASDQVLLDKYLRNVVRGKLTFRNDKIAGISGVTNNEDYHRRLKEKVLGTGVKFELLYDPDAKSMSAGTATGEPQSGSGKLEQAASEAKEELKSQLKKYKVYFASGKKSLDAKYNPLLEKAAKTILNSKDKKSVIVIGGYADHSGNAASNASLSRARAASVQAKLVELGVPINRTKVEFFGAEKASSEKWKSRRVEIRVR